MYLSVDARANLENDVTKEMNWGMVTELAERVSELEAALKASTAAFDELRGVVEELATSNNALVEGQEQLEASCAELRNEVLGALNGFEEPEDGVPEDESEEQRATRVGLLARVGELEALVRGRNRSAPVKRNMTDADAVRVLTGDVTELGHKEAGEQVGLTYAQVYSCRMEYTFKHVHKRLRDDGWKNPFVK